MQVNYIHAADVHLGYQQYGRAERADDFARAFKQVCDRAIATRPDFLLIAGDLFHKRNVDARTVSQAYELLTRLKDAGVPVLCVEGNHERAFYNSSWTWLDFLSSTGLLYLLAPTHAGGTSRLDPWDEEQRLGGYVEIGPTRVYGIKYHGASAPIVLSHIAEQLTQLPERPFSVMMLHEGMEGQLPRATGGLSSSQMEVLRPHCDYLALGHIHKQYDFGGWAFNPGSLETCSAEEVSWQRGYYEVTADLETRTLVRVEHKQVARRPFRRVFVSVESCDTPTTLEALVLGEIERQVRREHDREPVLDVTLRGTLQFSDDALDLRVMEAKVQEQFSPLLARIRNSTLPVGYAAGVAVGEDGQIDRRALELTVLTELVARDSRYAGSAAEWAGVFQELKDSGLQRLPPEEILHLLERGYDQVHARLKDGTAA